MVSQPRKTLTRTNNETAANRGNRVQKLLPNAKRIFGIIPEKMRRSTVALFAAMVITSLFETAGVATVMPFMKVVGMTKEAAEQTRLIQVLNSAGISTQQQQTLAVGGAVVLVILVSGFLRAGLIWRTNRYCQLTGHELANVILAGYLRNKYEYYLTRHSVDLAKNVLHEVHQVVNGVIHPALLMLSRGLTAGLIILLMISVEPKITIATISLLTFAYAIIYEYTKRTQAGLGEVAVRRNQERYKIASNIFSAIKEIKLSGGEGEASARFSGPSREYAESLALSSTLSTVPRYLLEGVALSGAVVVLLILMNRTASVQEAIPLISMYAFSVYRIMPSMQEIYGSITRIQFSLPSLSEIEKEATGSITTHKEQQAASASIQFENFEMSNVSYRYETRANPALKNVTLKIQAGEKVAIIGSTGSGKSTTLDIIIGLLEPSTGMVKVNGQPLNSEERINSWQRIIGYVPQEIMLLDDTVEANIRFASPSAPGTLEQAIKAAKTAQIHDFIARELPQGYNTRIGERGIALSGGQRQRLALARALYNAPQVIVLDEATSALDANTEQLVTESITGLGGNITVICVAHRRTAIANTDRIIRLQDGIAHEMEKDNVLNNESPETQET